MKHEGTFSILECRIHNGGAVITECCPKDKFGADRVYIPEYISGYPVREIGPDVFWGLTLWSVTIPRTVRMIRSGAFTGCRPEWNVYLPADCRWEDGAFDPGTHIHQPENESYYIVNEDGSLTMTGMDGDYRRLPLEAWGRPITKYAPSDLWGVKTLSIPAEASVKVVLGSTEIQAVIYEPGSVEIPEEAFSFSCGLLKLVLPDSIEKIGAEAFAVTDLQEISYPDGSKTELQPYLKAAMELR